jgi:hypothetical protein
MYVEYVSTRFFFLPLSPEAFGAFLVAAAASAGAAVEAAGAEPSAGAFWASPFLGVFPAFLANRREEKRREEQTGRGEKTRGEAHRSVSRGCGGGCG